MKITVRKNGINAIIVTFHTHAEKFESEYERSKFFRELHGWNQTIPRNGKRYMYRRKGVLDEVPHIKVADSAFIVALENMRRMENYFDEWADKVECEMMQIMLRDRTLLRQLMTQNEG